MGFNRENYRRIKREYDGKNVREGRGTKTC